jgi:hypothetical protein
MKPSPQVLQTRQYHFRRIGDGVRLLKAFGRLLLVLFVCPHLMPPRTVVEYHSAVARAFRRLRPSPHKLNQGQFLFFVFGLNGLSQGILGILPEKVYR